MKRNTVLWTVQGLLAVVFLVAGVTKLVLPIDAMQQGTVHFSGAFLRFIGVAETLGALGLILPGLLRIQEVLTPVAAAGLVVIMIGASVVTAVSGPAAAALFPCVVGVLAASVAIGRARVSPMAAAITPLR
jgi:uncharacterized membrane protein YphA (DoxX/SURF4 family)